MFKNLDLILIFSSINICLGYIIFLSSLAGGLEGEKAAWLQNLIKMLPILRRWRWERLTPVHHFNLSKMLLAYLVKEHLQSTKPPWKGRRHFPQRYVHETKYSVIIVGLNIFTNDDELILLFKQTLPFDKLNKSCYGGKWQRGLPYSLYNVHCFWNSRPFNSSPHPK